MRTGALMVTIPGLLIVGTLHAVEAKVSFVQKLGEDVCGVGAYQ